MQPEREGEGTEGESGWLAGWLPDCLTAVSACFPPSLPPSIVLRGACSNTSIKIRIS